MVLHQITYLSCNYIQLHTLHVITLHYMCYMCLHTITCWLHATHLSGGDPPPNEPPMTALSWFTLSTTGVNNPDARGYGRVNSGTWFEAAQLRANSLAAAGGHGWKCAVAGLVWVSDASFGGVSTTWHGVYGTWNQAH